MARPNWYKIRLPGDLDRWARECLEEYVDLSKYQRFEKVSVSCKNNGRNLFVRLLFEGRIPRQTSLSQPYRRRRQKDGANGDDYLPVCYLIEVNHGILKGQAMNYDLGDGVMYHQAWPVWNETIVLEPSSKLMTERFRLLGWLRRFDIPLIQSQSILHRSGGLV